jgi:hypothetical protein
LLVSFEWHSACTSCAWEEVRAPVPGTHPVPPFFFSAPAAHALIHGQLNAVHTFARCVCRRRRGARVCGAADARGRVGGLSFAPVAVRPIRTATKEGRLPGGHLCIDSRAAQRGADFRTVCAGDVAHACVVRRTREAGPGASAPVAVRHNLRFGLLKVACPRARFWAVTHGSLLRHRI